MRSTRRRHLAALTSLFVGACSMGSMVVIGSIAGCQRQARCRRCGMILDPSSRWIAEIREGDTLVARFDTPKCALAAQRSGTSRGVVHLHGYYTLRLAPISDLALAVGSDVLGPMGADLVPIELEHQARFRVEHAARAMLREADLTDEIVQDPR